MKKKFYNISIFGNTNNYLIRFALALRYFGHNVKLIVNRKEALHRPESLYPEFRIQYPDWIYDFSEIEEHDYLYQNHNLHKILYILSNKVDFVILNDVGLSLKNYISVPHMAFLTGSDLNYYADFKSLKLITKSWGNDFKKSLEGRILFKKHLDLILRQREGIISAKKIYHMDRGLLPENDSLLDDFGVDEKMKIFFQMSNLNDIKFLDPANNKVLTLLNGSRIDFTNPEKHSSKNDMKGSNILLEGISKFIEKGYKIKLKLVKKGKDIDDLKNFISNYKLEKFVEWIDEAYLFEFYDEMSQVDLVCDQFGDSFPGLVSLDSYAMGRPVLSNLRNDIFCKRYEGGLPGFDAKNADEICEQLVKIENNRDLLRYKALESREFAEKNLCPKLFVKNIINIFKK